MLFTCMQLQFCKHEMHTILGICKSNNIMYCMSVHCHVGGHLGNYKFVNRRPMLPESTLKILNTTMQG